MSIAVGNCDGIIQVIDDKIKFHSHSVDSLIISCSVIVSLGKFLIIFSIHISL